MDNSKKILLGLLALVIAFAVGRFSANTAPSVTEQQTTTNNDIKQVDKDTHKETTITKTRNPTGDEKTVTTITEDTTTKVKDVDTATTTESKVIVPSKRNTLTVSALVGMDTTRSFLPTYGLQVSKEVLGPISIGAFGFSNGLFGLSVGLSF